MPTADMFGLRPDVLPQEVEDLTRQLEGYDPQGSFRTEALHYQEEACGMTMESRNSFVAHVIGALRLRFKRELQRIEEGS